MTDPPQSNTALNLSVLRRHNPSTHAILSIAPYAVIYLFSPPTQSWEKLGIEGTLFVCSLYPACVSGPERYNVTVLNRRGLENFTTELRDPRDVEVTEEYVILSVAGDEARNGNGNGEEGEGGGKVYGLWIFSEPEPSSTARAREINARVILECAVAAERGRKAVDERERLEESQRTIGAVRPGQQISLQELFRSAT
jgi:hypothetical protein